MKRFLIPALALILSGPLAAMDPTVSGDYLEVRTSDVYTGPCFANGEVGLAGREAILAWRVREGSWQGVRLDDLQVVAVVNTDVTLGDPFAAGEAKVLLMLDERADVGQREALTALARSMAAPLLDNVVATQTAPISIEADAESGEASVRAGTIAGFSTRGLNHHDHLCGNETVYYPPLAEVEAAPAYAKSHWFSGDGLGRTWSSPFKRSAFVGRFVR